jgi:homoserine kinase
MWETQLLRPGTVASVRAPCSTSNLGPGFDCAGLALGLRLEVRARIVADARASCLILSVGEERDWPTGPENLLLAGVRRGLEASGAPKETAFVIEVSSDIPTRRGLGSSGAAIVAGLVLGASAGPREVSREELLELALALEGHPDNVTAALFGGCVLSLPVAGQRTRVVRQPLHESLCHIVAWPHATLETSFARTLLPPAVAFADAVENPRRLALLLEGLRTGDRDLLELGGEDRLHVRHRLPHIPGGARALAAAREAGAWLATISGSGSALYAISDEAHELHVALAMQRELERASPPASAHCVRPADGVSLRFLR